MGSCLSLILQEAKEQQIMLISFKNKPELMGPKSISLYWL
jgi:hypothetical protein